MQSPQVATRYLLRMNAAVGACFGRMIHAARVGGQISPTVRDDHLESVMRLRSQPKIRWLTAIADSRGLLITLLKQWLSNRFASVNRIGRINRTIPRDSAFAKTDPRPPHSY